jgi:hypothetical protein
VFSDNRFEINMHWGGTVCLHVSGTRPLNITRLNSVLGTTYVIQIHFLTFSVYLLRILLFLSFLLPFFSAFIYFFPLILLPSSCLFDFHLSFNPLVLHLFSFFFSFRQYFQLTLIDASKEVGLEVNTEKTKYMLLSRHQNARQNHDIKTLQMF